MFKTKILKIIANCLVYGLASVLTQRIRGKITTSLKLILFFWQAGLVNNLCRT